MQFFNENNVEHVFEVFALHGDDHKLDWVHGCVERGKEKPTPTIYGRWRVGVHWMHSGGNVSRKHTLFGHTVFNNPQNILERICYGDKETPIIFVKSESLCGPDIPRLFEQRRWSDVE
jgi:hypothetical protein